MKRPASSHVESGFVFLLLIALSMLAPDAQAQGGSPSDTLKIKLETAVARALEISPEVAVERAGLNFAAARSRLARASRFLTDFQATTAHSLAPGLSIPTSDFDRNALYLLPDVRNEWDKLRPFNQIEVKFTQPIYTWGELGGSIRAARYGVAVEEAAVRQKAAEVALRTGELYYSLLLADALSRLTGQAGDVVRQAKETIDRLLEEGESDVDDADRYQVLITEQEYTRRVVEVVQKRMTAQAALTRQLFLPENAALAAEDEVLEPIPFALDSLDAYLQLALVNRPEVAQASAGIQARDALVDVARSSYYPKLFLAGSARYAYAAGRYRQPNPYISDPFLSRSLLAGLGLRQNLNFAQTKARVEQAEAERSEVRYQLEAAQQLVRFEVEDAYRNVIIARAAVDAQDQSLLLSREWLRTEQINFDLALGDTENLVDAVRASLEIEANYYDAVQRYNVAVLRLLRAAGILLNRIESGTLVD